MANWMAELGYRPQHLKELRSCAYLYYKQGHFTIAQKMFKGLTILDKKSPYDLNILGAISLQLGNIKEAMNYFLLALEIDPTYLPALFNRFKALMISGQKQNAADLATILLNSKEQRVQKETRALIKSYHLPSLVQ